MTSPKALIFDIDGTLWDSVALVGEGYNLQLIDDGHPELCISEAKLRTLFGKTMVDLADGMLAGLPKEQRMEQMEQMLRRGITEEELNNWFAVSEKIRSNLEHYQGNLCREGQKNGKTVAEKRA